MTSAPTAEVVAGRLAAVRQRIEAAGGRADQVRILAVTKGFDRSACDVALGLGLVELGENYAQELIAKAAELGPGPQWHFIGRLQRNKVRHLAPLVQCWQTVDRAELADEIARRAPGAEVFVQVNVSSEPQKGGVAPDDTAGLVAHARSIGLAVRGLMTVGATGDPEAARAGFRTLRRLADGLSLAECSMGMTGDLEVAVSEGSTMIRVGTALFGPRLRSAEVRD